MNFLSQIIPVARAQVASNALNTAQNVGNQTSNQLSEMIARAIAAIPLWITAFIVMVGFYFLAIAIRRYSENKFFPDTGDHHKELQIVVGRISFMSTLIIGATIALSIVGINLSPIVAAGAFGLGFALQDIIMNTISGLMILASRHFTIGDTISVGSVTGVIQEIQTRATLIKAFDGTRVIVPNSQLFKSVVISKTSNPYRRLEFAIGVGYDVNLKKFRDITLAVVKQIPGILIKPRPGLVFSKWGDFAITAKIRVWIDSKGGKFLSVKNKVMLDLTEAYSQAGINLPYPIQTIKFDESEAVGSHIGPKKRRLRISQILSDLKAHKKTIPSTSGQSTLPADSAAINANPANWLKQSFEPVKLAETVPAQLPPSPPPLPLARPAMAWGEGRGEGAGREIDGEGPLPEVPAVSTPSAPSAEQINPV